MGFEVKRFINLTENEKKLSCPICFGIFDDPVLVVCGHMFCRKCISLLMNEYGKENCPVCRKDLIKNNFVPVIGLYKDMLNNLRIRCDFDYLGCNEIVKIELLPKHIVQCLEVEIACSKGCGYEIKRKDYDNHNCVSFLKSLVADKESSAKAKLGEKDAIITERDAEIKSLTEKLNALDQECAKLKVLVADLQKSLQESGANSGSSSCSTTAAEDSALQPRSPKMMRLDSSQ